MLRSPCELELLEERLGELWLAVQKCDHDDLAFVSSTSVASGVLFRRLLHQSFMDIKYARLKYKTSGGSPMRWKISSLMYSQSASQSSHGQKPGVPIMQ